MMPEISPASASASDPGNKDDEGWKPSRDGFTPFSEPGLFWKILRPEVVTLQHIKSDIVRKLVSCQAVQDQGQLRCSNCEG